MEGKIAKHRDGLESKLALAHARKTIQVVLDARLSRATDRAARHANLSRSAQIRNVLSEHLRTPAIHRLEAQDRKGYQLRPQGSKNCLVGNGPLCGHVDPSIRPRTQSIMS
jgi:hypothetical protein